MMGWPAPYTVCTKNATLNQGDDRSPSKSSCNNAGMKVRINKTTSDIKQRIIPSSLKLSLSCASSPSPFCVDSFSGLALGDLYLASVRQNPEQIMTRTKVTTGTNLINKRLIMFKHDLKLGGNEHLGHLFCGIPF